MSDSVDLSAKPPETILDPPPPEASSALDAALAADESERKARLSEVVARFPRVSDGWAHLGEVTDDGVEAYAYFRVGYHRGLDTLRASGWRGSGYVRWQHSTNRGFLRALSGLQRQAGVIGEADEAERCDLFLRQLDPSWPPAELA